MHGHGAHAHWWDFIAPAFTADHDVVAIDLSGSGDSDHREAYSATTFAKEINAVYADCDLASPVIVGHSFGGSMTRITAHLYPELADGIVLVDSVLPAGVGNRTPPPMPRVKTRYYETLSSAVRRFRLRPPQPCDNDFIVEHIANHSLKRTPQGFAFKLDQAVFAKMTVDENPLPAAQEMVRSLHIPVGFIYGLQSRFFPAVVVDELETLIDDHLLIGIPDAHHHVFLDQPLAFTHALKTLLARIAARRGGPRHQS